MSVNIFSFAPLPEALQERRCVAALRGGAAERRRQDYLRDGGRRLVQNDTK